MTSPLKGPRVPLVPAIQFIKDTPGFFRACAQRYGDPFVTQAPAGRVTVTGNPRGIQEIFSADPETFEPMSGLVLEPVVGSNSLLLLNGERHKRERRLLMPSFHGERMRAYGALMQ